MKRALQILIHLLAIIIVLVIVGVVIALIHYAIYGSPIKDTEHIINGIKKVSYSKTTKPSNHPSSTHPSNPSPTGTLVNSALPVTPSSSKVQLTKAAPAPDTVGSPSATPAANVSAETPAAPTSDKYDGDCPQPYATVGRCADKCPNPGDTLLGFDPTTGASICKAAPTGCPYGDSVPLGPECDKLAAEAQL